MSWFPSSLYKNRNSWRVAEAHSTPHTPSSPTSIYFISSWRYAIPTYVHTRIRYNLVTPSAPDLLPLRRITISFQSLPTTLSTNLPHCPLSAPTGCCTPYGRALLVGTLQFPILAVIHVRIIHQLLVSNSATDCDTIPILHTTTSSFKILNELVVGAPNRSLQVGVQHSKPFQQVLIDISVCPKNVNRLRVCHASSTIPLINDSLELHNVLFFKTWGVLTNTVHDFGGAQPVN